MCDSELVHTHTHTHTHIYVRDAGCRYLRSGTEFMQRGGTLGRLEFKGLVRHKVVTT
jgi:hypothetical protein